MELVCYGQEVKTIFDLLGTKENDMTFALGWVLSRSKIFLKNLLLSIYGECPWDLANAVVKLQTGRGKDGVTDIEIDIDSDVALIIEAKKGPQLPFPQQLTKYANVLNSKTLLGNASLRSPMPVRLPLPLA